MDKHSLNENRTDLLKEDSFVEYALYKEKSEHHAFWNNWIKQNPDKRSDFEYCILLVRKLRNGLAFYEETAIAESVQEILLKKILNSISKIESDYKWKFFKTYKEPVGIAASLILLAGIFFLYFQIRTVNITNLEFADSKGLVHSYFQAPSDNTLEVLLSDGSKIRLSPNSSLKVLKGFGIRNREVQLSGNAYFDISKVKRMPFLIWSGGILTKVLGTKFTIETDKEHGIKVSVFHGKVSVSKFTDDLENGVLLAQNQEVWFDEDGQKFKKSIMKNAGLVSPDLINEFKFEETNLSEVYKTISAAYGIKIEADREIIKNCQLTADLNGLSFFQKLDLINETFHSHYTSIEGEILIEPNECK